MRTPFERLRLPCKSGGAAYCPRFFEDADDLFVRCRRMTKYAVRDKQRIRGGFGEAGTFLIGSTRADAKPWKGTILKRIRDVLQSRLGVSFNFVLYNFYEDSTDSIAYHSDSERNSIPLIASVTLGMERPFRLMNLTTTNEYSLNLQHGSLLIIWGTFNREYMHCVPPFRTLPQQASPRINLTFRIVTLSLLPRIVPQHKYKESPFFTRTRKTVPGMVGIVNWGKVGKIETDFGNLKERCERLNGREGTYWFLVPAPGVTRQQLIDHLISIQPHLQWKWRIIRNCLVPIIRWHELLTVSNTLPGIHPSFRPGVNPVKRTTIPFADLQKELAQVTE